MSHWNYRVIASYKSNIVYYTINECYYNNLKDKIPHSWTEGVSAPCCDSVEGLKESLNMMLLAFNKPVLVEEFDGEGNVVRLVEDN